MKVFYFYHIPKTGGTYVSNNLEKVSKDLVEKHHKKVCYKDFTKLKKKKFWENRTIDLDRLLLKAKKTQYDFLFIHHHHGYHGLESLHGDILRAKETLKKEGHEFFLICTMRELHSFHESRLNYLVNHLNSDLTIEKIIEEEENHNFMSKYFLYNHPHVWPDSMEINKRSIEKIINLVDVFLTTQNLLKLESFLRRETGFNVEFIKEKTKVSRKTKFFNEGEILKLNEINNWDIFLYEKFLSKSQQKD